MFAKYLRAVAAGALLLGALAAPAMAQKTTLTIYTSLWEQRCVCPRQGKDATRAMKKIRR